MSPAAPDPRRRLGDQGEAAAALELQARGYTILARNYRCRSGEADLVAEESGDLVFVEVKTRTSLRHGLPREAVDWTKQQRLVHAAEHYLSTHEVEDRPVRFDVIEVVLLHGRIAHVEVIQNAFHPE